MAGPAVAAADNVVPANWLAAGPGSSSILGLRHDSTVTTSLHPCATRLPVGGSTGILCWRPAWWAWSPSLLPIPVVVAELHRWGLLPTLAVAWTNWRSVLTDSGFALHRSPPSS